MKRQKAKFRVVSENRRQFFAIMSRKNYANYTLLGQQAQVKILTGE
jgi:hypothetical protein